MGSKVVTDKDILYSLKHITNLEEGDERPSRENNKLLQVCTYIKNLITMQWRIQSLS